MSSSIKNNIWIKDCNPSNSIGTLMIPGTHDSMTASCELRYYKTQHLDLLSQLNIGVRFLDIRLRKEMVAAHRDWISNIKAEQILDICHQFLEVNSKEFILMRIQNANEKKDDYDEYGKALKSVIKNYRNLFYTWSINEKGNFILPTIKQAAGKIIAFECSPLDYSFYRDSKSYWAAPWHDNPTLIIQDLWDGPSIEQKKQAIKGCLDKTSLVSDDMLLLNHISATNGDQGFPDAYAEKLNPFTLQIWNNRVNQMKGIQIYDFITEELCHKIVNLNKL